MIVIVLLVIGVYLYNWPLVRVWPQLQSCHAVQPLQIDEVRFIAVRCPIARVLSNSVIPLLYVHHVSDAPIFLPVLTAPVEPAVRDILCVSRCSAKGMEFTMWLRFSPYLLV